MKQFKQFSIIKDIVSSTALKQMCDEMDMALKEVPIDGGRIFPRGRRPGTDRYKIKDNPKYKFVNSWARSMIDLFLDPTQYQIGFLSYVRQKESNNIHTDANPSQGSTYTFLLPLRNIRETDCTVVFDHNVKTNEHISALDSRIRAQQHYQPLPMKDNHIEKYKLHHLSPWINNMTVLGVFPYRLGDAVMFNAHLLHCSNDWKSLEEKRSHKDYVLLHASDRFDKNFDASKKDY